MDIQAWNPRLTKKKDLKQGGEFYFPEYVQ